MSDGLRFVHDVPAQRVRFGSGLAATSIAAEVAGRSAQRTMLVASRSSATLVDAISRDIHVALLWTESAPHVPADLADRATAAAARESVDLIVCVGGGSSLGLAKAVALSSGVPIVAVPTTYAGSEATNVWGLTENGVKRTGSDDRVRPEVVIYDSHLVETLPKALAMASGFNAIAHCIDSFWAPHADPISSALASEGLRALAEGFRRIALGTSSSGGQEGALVGAYLAGTAFSSAGAGLHHKICHVLGGAYDLPHAETHAALLPYVVAYNIDDSPEAASRIRRALGADDALRGVVELRRTMSVALTLQDLGMPHERIAAASAMALPLVPASNPRRVDESALESILEAAWDGSPPESLRHGVEHGRRR